MKQQSGYDCINRSNAEWHFGITVMVRWQQHDCVRVFVCLCVCLCRPTYVSVCVNRKALQLTVETTDTHQSLFITQGNNVESVQRSRIIA